MPGRVVLLEPERQKRKRKTRVRLTRTRIINDKLLKSIEPEGKPFDVRDKTVPGFLVRVEPSGLMTFKVQYARGKRLNLGPVHLRTPTDARKIAGRALAKAAELKNTDMAPAEFARLVKDHALGLGVYPRTSDVTLRKFIDEATSRDRPSYADWRKEHRHRSEEDLKRVRTKFEALLDKPLAHITSAELERWRTERLNAGRKATTVNRDLATLKVVFSKAVEWGVLERSPIRSIKPMKVDARARIRFLSDDEERALLKAVDERDTRIKRERASANAWRKERGYKLMPNLARHRYADHFAPLVQLAINTGLRRGELLSLRWADVHLTDNPHLTVRGIEAKSGRTRHVPLNRTAHAALADWRKQTDSAPSSYVFAAANGDELTSVRRPWDDTLVKAKITDFRFHDLRHSFASKLVMKGVDLNTVRELLGHKDLTMTLRYAHLAPGHTAAAVAKLDE